MRRKAFRREGRNHAAACGLGQHDKQHIEARGPEARLRVKSHKEMLALEHYCIETLHDPTIARHHVRNEK